MCMCLCGGIQAKIAGNQACIVGIQVSIVGTRLALQGFYSVREIQEIV